MVAVEEVGSILVQKSAMRGALRAKAVNGPNSHGLCWTVMVLSYCHGSRVSRPVPLDKGLIESR